MNQLDTLLPVSVPVQVTSDTEWRETTLGELHRRISALKSKVSLNINGIWDANNGGPVLFFDADSDSFCHVLDLLSNGFIRLQFLNHDNILTSVLGQLKIFRIPFVLDETLDNLLLAESEPLTPALWEDLCAQVEELARISSQKVLLNFRGTTITANRSVLNKSAWFRAQLSSRWAPEADGAYFIDRNARYFLPVLNFLQTGKYQFDPTLRPEFEAELDFFLIERRTECKWDETLCSENTGIRLENQRRAYKKASSEYGFNAAVIGTEPVTYVKYKAVRCPERDGILFGLGPRETFQPTTGRAHGDEYGFFIYSNRVVFGRGKTKANFPILLSGDEIEFRVVSEAQTIEVKTSDCSSFQVAFEGIGTSELYPIIDMDAPGACEIEIVETRWSPA